MNELFSPVMTLIESQGTAFFGAYWPAVWAVVWSLIKIVCIVAQRDIARRACAGRDKIGCA